MELTNKSNIVEILDRYGFTFSKKLGQNFLVNPTVCPKMAENAVMDGEEYVLEIGPGIGVLTKELSKVAKKVIAVELDKRLIPVLKETLQGINNIEIINDDIMNVDINTIFPQGAKIAVCANLPYYITTPILMYLLEGNFNISSITVMVQKETADRLCAHLGTRECGSISGAIEYYSTAEKLFNVSAGSFMPMPKVDSTVIKLVLKNVESNPDLFKFIRASFAERRKTAINSLASNLGIGKSELVQRFVDAGIDINARAEKITLSQYIKVSKGR